MVVINVGGILALVRKVAEEWFRVLLAPVQNGFNLYISFVASKRDFAITDEANEYD